MENAMSTREKELDHEIGKPGEGQTFEDPYWQFMSQVRLPFWLQ